MSLPPVIDPRWRFQPRGQTETVQGNVLERFTS
jgi:hypothetical protein